MYIYADNAATTKTSQAAIKAMNECMEDFYGNPSSLHSVGQRAAEKLLQARMDVAECLGADFKEIYFTSGGSEADNQAIVSAATFGAKKGKKHISKRGRSKLRRNLKQIGIALVKNNNFFLQLHTYYTTERDNKLSKLISINAIIRKFTYIMMSIVKTGESFSVDKAIKESCIFN